MNLLKGLGTTRAGAIALLLAGMGFGQNLPTAKSVAAEMTPAWNLGNSFEATGGPTAWGNPLATQKLIDSVKAEGFRTVRIPVAWDANADQTTHVINANWMTQIKTVVDYCIKDSLFVVLNIHWDGGWLENKIDSAATFPAMRAKIAAKQGAYWRQIATTFRSYDRHLLFASTNEPNVANAASMVVLNSFHQIFLDTVRATGGNNASRTLVIQGPSTDIEKTNKLMLTLPTDKIADRLMAEVHFYPYQFTLMTKDEGWGNMFYYWGKGNHSGTDAAHNATWGEEAWVDSMFNLMKTQFVDKGIPVLLGELGAIKRLTLSGDNLTKHLQSRLYWYNYVVASAKNRGLIPVIWDAGGKGDGTMTVIDRASGSVYDLELLNAIRTGAGLPARSGGTSVTVGANSMKVLYSAKDSLFGQVELGVVKPNISAYDSIVMRAYVNGKTNYDSGTTTKSGFVSLSLVTMSNNWKWRAVDLGNPTFDTWKTYSIPLSTDSTDKRALASADPTKIDFFGLQAYSKGFYGTIYVDYIVFKTKAGVSDTLYSFNSTVPDIFKGNVMSVTSIPTSAVTADQEWKTATSGYVVTSVWGRSSRESELGIARSANGSLRASFSVPSSATALATLTNVAGKTVWSRSIVTQAGPNQFEFPVQPGLAVLKIQQGSLSLVRKVLHP